MKRKGFTTIELLVSLAIMTLVMGIILPFYLSNERNLNAVEVRSELQMNGQQAIEALSRRGMETKDIITITASEGGLSMLETSQAVKIKELIFRSDAGSISHFKLDSGKLSFSNTETGGTERVVAENVKSIEVKPVDFKNYMNCRGIEVTVSMEKKQILYEIKSTIYFRNKDSAA